MKHLSIRDRALASSKSADLVDSRLEQISFAAMTCFARAGYHTTTVSQVAEEAGLGKGTIYEYVKSKKELLLLVMEEGHRRFRAILSEAAGAPTDPVSRLKTIIRCTVGFCYEHCDAAKSIVPVIMALDESDAIGMENDKDEATEICASVIKDGIKDGTFRKVNASLYAELILHLCWMRAYPRFGATPTTGMEEMANAVVDMALDGLVARK